LDERPIDRVLGHLEKVTPSGPGQWTACCPAHDDSTPSLSISEKADGKVLMYCQAGCETNDVVAAINLRMQDLFATRSATRNGHSPQTTDTVNGNGKTQSRDKNRTTPTKPKSKSRSNGQHDKRWQRLAQKYANALSSQKLNWLARKLGIAPTALHALDVGWCETTGGGVYTFPERDGAGHIIGISTRSPDGKKGMITGGHRGLYLPEGWRARRGPILIAEGATCTATLTELGLAGIGRPNAQGGADLLAKLLQDVPTKRPIIVLGEYDPKPDGKWPGLDGAKAVAQKLANALGRAVSWCLPPDGAKDVRAWLIQRKGESQ
jgi:hypothetical protein